MKVITYYNFNISNFNEIFFENEINRLPDFFKNRIALYSSFAKKQQRIASLLLLEKAIFDFKLDTALYNLKNLNYSENGKPFFDDTFNFSIAYSDDCAVLAVLLNEKIGIDIEKIRSIDLNNYQDYFTENELNIINNSNEKMYQFFAFWTRKEALSKALGLGMFLNFNTIEVIENKVKINDEIFVLETHILNENYIYSSAKTMKLKHNRHLY